jgi:NADPH:quinone reductase-like Zn-dependent oxidoreductase
MSKAFVFTQYGGAEVQQMVDMPLPTPGPGQLLVAVRAAGVNPIDWKVRAGYFQQMMPVELPAVLGCAAAGVVQAIGEGVDGCSVGDEVFAALPLVGAYAEYALFPAASTVAKPAGISFEIAATLPVAAAAAYDGIEQVALKEGQTLLVLGAGGGVGAPAVQLARARGIRVLGVASAGKQELVQSLGGIFVLSGEGVEERIREISPDGVDAVFDLVGGETVRALAGLAHDSSRVVSAADYAIAEIGGAALEHPDAVATLRALGELAEAGTLTPQITATFSLDDAGAALALVEEGHVSGKVVITVS